MVEHWVLGRGWLAELGYIDYAGSSVVHMVGGMLAITGAYVIGPRIRKFVGKNNLPRTFFGHSIPLSVIGAASIALWAGAMGLVMFAALKKLKLLKVSGDELYGLDIAFHNTMAYPEDMMEEN